MTTLLIYGLTLLLAVLISGIASRSILSGAVLFLVAGLLSSTMGWASYEISHPVVRRVAEMTLVATLFTDALRVPFKTLRGAWHLPGRALLLGLPLTMLITAGLALVLAGLSWTQALLVAAALSPTDPVLASALVGESRVPQRLRRLLNVESGLNDGLALPFVVVLLSRSQSQQASWLILAAELAGGILIGVVVPVVAVWLYRRRWFGAIPSYRPLFGFAVGLLVYALASELHGNPFLAAFAAGITLSSMSPTARRHFEPVGERLTELLKFAALLVFGIMISFSEMAAAGWRGWLLAAGVLLVARPASILISLIWSAMSWRERLTAAWFGPRGFASVLFGLMILDSGLQNSGELFRLIAVTIVLSIVVHASTDVFAGRWFKKTAEEANDPPRPQPEEEEDLSDDLDVAQPG
jgi:NhaP-type Na+/H+ or K+/H+ antiporter